MKMVVLSNNSTKHENSVNKRSCRSQWHRSE